MNIHSTTFESELVTGVNKPVLSLCIPTYNRREKLARLVNGIQQDLQNAGGKIEICISDNASTDGTNKLVMELSTHKYISVYRQSENVGFLKNYAAVFSMARGNYVWILGDDDVVVKNGLEKLLQLLEKESPNYIYVHIASAASNSPTYFQNIKPGKHSANVLRSMFSNEGLDMFGFIGSHIFPKSSLDILTSSTEVLASGWPHLVLVLAASDNLESFLVTEPLARQIGDGLFWSPTNWVLVNMRKVDVLILYKPKWTDKNLKFFFITNKTLLSKSPIANLLNAKILEPGRFSEIVTQSKYYFKKSKGILRSTILIYWILIVVIKYFPIGYILKKIKPAYYRNKIKKHLDLKMEKSFYEGYSREPAPE